MHAATLREIESKHVCIMNISNGTIAEYYTRPTRPYGNLTKNIPWILKYFCGLKQSVNSVKIACFLNSSFFYLQESSIVMEANKC